MRLPSRETCRPRLVAATMSSMASAPRPSSKRMRARRQASDDRTRAAVIWGSRTSIPSASQPMPQSQRGSLAPWCIIRRAYSALLTVSLA